MDMRRQRSSRTAADTLAFGRVQVKKDQFWASLTHGLSKGVRFYAGHTRFATSSIVSLPSRRIPPLLLSLAPAAMEESREAHGALASRTRVVRCRRRRHCC